MTGSYDLYEMHWKGDWKLHKIVLVGDGLKSFRIF